MKKGIFIEGITVEMLKNASLEAVEELISCGDIIDVKLPFERWIPVSEDKPEPFQEVLVTLHENGWNGETYDTVKSQAYDGDY